MADGNEAMSHNDIWDDSLLVDSWNQALDEYKKYHSIHAKGIPLDEIASEAHETEPKVQEGQCAGGSLEEGKEQELQDVCAEQGVSEKGGPIEPEASGPTAMPTPQGLLGSVQDEGLKRLLMSWYYAGYYTGLYEGQQKGEPSS